MRRIALFSAITAGHFVLNLAVLFVGGGAIMAEFDGHGSHLAASVSSLLMTILNSPLVSLVRIPPWVGTLGEYAILAFNSMLWGAAGVWVWWKLTGWRRRAVKGGG
jgi:predicted ABC-type sugar transport system permease subunit